MSTSAPKPRPIKNAPRKAGRGAAPTRNRPIPARNDDQGALSPDGKQLAFVSSRGTGSADIWVLDLPTKKARNLTHAPGSFRPSWSSDGKWIAFSSDRNTPVRRLDAERFAQVHAVSIYVMRVDGTDVRRLTAAGKFAGSPKWSPDGERVVFYEMEIQDTYYAMRPCENALSDQPHSQSAPLPKLHSSLRTICCCILSSDQIDPDAGLLQCSVPLLREFKNEVECAFHSLNRTLDNDRSGHQYHCGQQQLWCAFGAFRLLGRASPLAFVLAAVAMAVIMLCMAEVASQFSEPGGPYLYVRSAFGRLAGTQVAWFHLLAMIGTGAANVTLFVTYLGGLLPSVAHGWQRIAMLSLVIVVPLAVNYVGVRSGANFTSLLTIIKLLPLLFLIVLGIFHFSRHFILLKLSDVTSSRPTS